MSLDEFLQGLVSAEEAAAPSEVTQHRQTDRRASAGLVAEQ